MNNLTKLNKTLGWIIFVGLSLTQIGIVVSLWEAQVFIIVLLTGGIFLPFIIVGGISILDREKYKSLIRAGLITGIAMLIIIPIGFPLFFDQELIYISFIGIVVGIWMWLLRKAIEKQLLIVNVLGSVIILFVLLCHRI